MIIGISGKKRHGKDTIGNIIQAFAKWERNAKASDIYSFQKNYSISNQFVLKDVKEEISGLDSGWEVQKFAGVLKEIVSLMTGYTIEQLENNENKDKLLYYSYYIIKDNQRITDAYSSMEEAVEELKKMKTGFHNAYGDGEYQFSVEQERVTPRLLLQKIGTEVGRMINPDVWIKTLFNKYIGKSIGIDKVGHQTILYPNWIITDVRFPNEVKAIKEKGGIVIRVNRDLGLPIVDNHISETALDSYEEFDYIIENNNCIECLIEEVKKMIQIKKIKL